MTPPIDQNRSFRERLSDFGPELGIFLSNVWNARDIIDVSNYGTGGNQIYGMYSGTLPDRSYKEEKLKVFIDMLKNLAGTYGIRCQELGRTLGDLSDDEVSLHGPLLWKDFYHVQSTTRELTRVRTRVYVHGAHWLANIDIMKVLVAQFSSLPGLFEAKTCGPGARRLDTIVAYLYDYASRDALVKVLIKTAKANPGLFSDSLPPLIKREAAGIGSADEPPQVDIAKESENQSFGSLFSAVVWLALKNTPELDTPDADGRHMLDNVLHSLRILRVDPRNPQRFPDAALLEQWYQNSRLGKSERS
jgi:hypothetical protein